MIIKLLSWSALLFVCMAAMAGEGEITQNDGFEQARSLLKAGEPERAMEQLKPLLSAEPDNASARFLQARIHTAQGKTGLAIAGYEALIKDYPDLAEAYNNLAALYVRQNNLRLARLVLEQGMKTHTVYASLYRNISAIYMEMARKSYTEARLLKQEMPPLELQELPDLFRAVSGESAKSAGE